MRSYCDEWLCQRISSKALCWCQASDTGPAKRMHNVCKIISKVAASSLEMNIKSTIGATEARHLAFAEAITSLSQARKTNRLSRQSWLIDYALGEVLLLRPQNSCNGIIAWHPNKKDRGRNLASPLSQKKSSKPLQQNPLPGHPNNIQKPI